MANANLIIRFTLFSLVISLSAGSTPLIAEDLWYPSKYGAEDTIGAANNLNPEIVRKQPV